MEYRIKITGEALMRRALTGYILGSFYVGSISENSRVKRQTDNSSSAGFVAECEIKVASDLTVDHVTKNITEAINKVNMSSVFYGATVQVGEKKDEPELRDVCYQQADPSYGYRVFSECFHGYQVSTFLQAGLGNFTGFANVKNLLAKVDGEICSFLSIGWSCFNTTLHATSKGNQCSKETALTTILDYSASMGVNAMKLNTTLNQCAAQPDFWRYDQSICDDGDRIIPLLLSTCLLDWDEIDLLMPILFGDKTGIDDIGCRIGHRIFECGQNIAMNYDIPKYFQCKVEDISNALNLGGYWFDNLVPGLNVTQCLHQDSEIPYHVFDITIFFPVAWNEDMKHRIITTGEALMRQAMMQYYISGSFRIISISEIGRMKRQTSGNFSSGGFVAECEIKVASASAVTVQSVTNNITGAIYNRNSSSVFYGATVQVAKKKDEPGMPAPVLDCSDIDSIMFHLNQSCPSVQYLNTNDSTTYCKHLHASLLCARVVFNNRPYMAGKCNDSVMVMAIKSNEEKFKKVFGGKNISSCNILYEGNVQYRHLNGSHIKNITKTLGSLPCENNSIEYIAKYNCNIRPEHMSDIEWHLMMNDTCGVAAWKKNCVDDTMKDWANTTCHNVKDVLKRNSMNIFGKNVTLENCTNDVCSSYGQLSVANQNWTNCMHLLVTALMVDSMINTGVNRNVTHLALCKLYNVSLQCVVNSTRNKGYNCSSAYMNKWAIPVISQYVKSMNTSLTRIDSSVAFDADTCPADSSGGQICALPAFFHASNAYGSLLYTHMMGTLSLLHNIDIRSFDGSDSTDSGLFTNETSGLRMNGSSTNENVTSHMPYPQDPRNASSIPANRQILVCSVYEMELGRILAYLDKEKNNCSVTNMLPSVKAAVALLFNHVRPNINPTAILDNCNGTVKKSNESICNPRKLMLKRAASCLWYWSDSCMSFQVFKHCVLSNNTFSTEDNCTYDQIVQAWKDGDHLKNLIYPHLNTSKCEDSGDKDPSEIPYKVFDITIFFPGGWNADMEYRIKITGEALMRRALTGYILGSFYVGSISEISRQKRQASDNSTTAGFAAECEIKIASDVSVVNVTRNITETINKVNISSVFYGATVQVGEKKDDQEHRDVCYQQTDPSFGYHVFSECFHGYQVSTYLQAGLGNFTGFANVQNLLSKVDGESCSLLSIGWSCFNTTLHAIWNENHCPKETALTTILDYSASIGVNAMKLNTTLNQCTAQPGFWKDDQSICDNEDHIIPWLLSTCLLDWDEIDVLMPVLFGNYTGIDDIGCRVGHHIFECAHNITMNDDIQQYFQCKVEDVLDSLILKGDWYDQLVPGLNVTKCFYQDD